MKTISWSKLIRRTYMYPALFSYGIELREAAMATFILLVLTI